MFLSLFFDSTSLFPVIEADLSDSGCVDNVLELLVMAGGRSLPEVWFDYSPSPLPRATFRQYNDTFMKSLKLKSFTITLILTYTFQNSVNLEI